MDIQFKCPQCGQIVVADDSYRGRTASCPFCANEIVIPVGVSAAVLSLSQSKDSSIGRILATMRKMRLASAPWSIQFSVIYIIAFSILFSIGDVIANGAFVTPFISLLMMIAAGLALARFKIARWLVVAFGAFNALAWMFGPDGRYWPFHISFIAIAVLLLLKPSGEWYRVGLGHNLAVNVAGFPKVAAMATGISLVAVIIIAQRFDIRRKEYARYLDRQSYRTLSESSSGDSVARTKGTGERQQATSESSRYGEEGARRELKIALENCRTRYKRNLANWGLQEIRFYFTDGWADLFLIQWEQGEQYEIVYYEPEGRLECPRSFSRDMAWELIRDRVNIYNYEIITSRTAMDKRQQKMSKDREVFGDTPPRNEEEYKTILGDED